MALGTVEDAKIRLICLSLLCCRRDVYQGATTRGFKQVVGGEDDSPAVGRHMERTFAD